MKWLKYISHPHSYIVFFLTISILTTIPNGLGWRHNMLGLTSDYFWLYFLYIIFYFLGYYLPKRINTPETRDLSLKTINYFHIIFLVSLTFFILKFIYIGGVPIFSNNKLLRVKLSALGGFVDFPTKAMSFLGIIAYYFFLKRKNQLYLVQFILSITLNLLFAERSLIVFTIIGALVIYLNHKTISFKMFRRTLIVSFLIFLSIGLIQIKRHGGKDHLNLSGEMSTIEVTSWVVHGDLTGSQKFGAFIVNKLDGEKLYGRYTLGIYLSLFIPNYKDHGATYVQKTYYPKARTAQSAAIPYSYFMDFGYFSLIFPFIIGFISRAAYEKFKPLNSPFYIMLYVAYFFNLLWSVRAGIFPIDPKLLYFVLMLIFIFNPQAKIKLNNQLIQLFRILFLATLALSFIALIIRW